ncbi:MAG: PAS domain S-box protein [Planctomycetes bacterium]|nr:PAS domain S-box protein [Planctomycetota bacterium]
MTVQREPVPAPPAPTAAGSTPHAPGATPIANAPGSPSRWPAWRLLALTVLLLALIHPLSWPGGPDPLWFPSAGLGLVLIAWFGQRAALLILLAAPFAAVRAALWPSLQGTEHWAELLGKTVCEGAFQAAMLAAAWWAYRRAGGQPDLHDPRSAVLFLLVPGTVAAGFAVLRTLPVWLATAFGFSLPRVAGAWWVSQELGIMALAPPLLVLATGNLELGIWHWKKAGSSSNAKLQIPKAKGDWVEVAGLALGTTLLSVLIIVRNPQEPGGWQLWGAPLLMVVWAGMRQGLAGATLTTAAGTVVSLEVLARLQPALSLPLLVQGNLLAQCGTAVLVAASASWVRHSELRYRQVVGQIPVVLYSTRLLAPLRPGLPPKAEVLFVSPPSVDVLSCPPEALLGDYTRWLQRVHADDREVLLAAVAQLGRQNQPVVCEYRLAPRPGEEPPPSDPARSPGPGKQRWLRDTLVPHLDADSRLTGWEGIVSDITEQRVLADDLRRTTSMFHALVANMPAGVFFVSAKSGRPILVNQRARQLLGQREDFSASLEHLSTVYRLHRPDGSLYPVEDLPVCQALRGGIVSMRDDIVVHRPDGRRIPLITWAAPLELSHSGRTDAVVWVLEDLTALRQAEAARYETEGRLRTVIESLAEGLLVQDRHGAVVDCNTAALTLLPGVRGQGSGVREEDVPGSLLTPDPCSLTSGILWLREDGSPLPPEEHPIRRVLRTGIPTRNVVLGITPISDRIFEIADLKTAHPDSSSNLQSEIVNMQSTRVRWVLVNSLPLAPRPGSSPAGVVTTLADITDHIHAQQLLRASEERYRGLMDSLPLMVVQFDRELRITFLNPATQATTGYTLEEGGGCAPVTWQQLAHPEDLPAFLDALHDALGGKSGRSEGRYRAKDGQEHFAYCLLQPLWDFRLQISDCRLEERGNRPLSSNLQSEISTLQSPVGVTVLILDMTRERRLEMELQRAQRLELVGRLSSGIAHDFNNLLTVLLGMSELANPSRSTGLSSGP